MSTYNELRKTYKPERIRYLFIAESPPPEDFAGGSRHFYRADKERSDDRLFTNTMWALYPETEGASAADLEADKEKWLRRFQADGFYMIESLETSLQQKVPKKQRQELIKEHLPELIERVRGLTEADTKLILIKSNVFVVAAEPLREAGFNVLNTELLDYPGHFNQRAYREKLTKMVRDSE